SPRWCARRGRGAPVSAALREPYSGRPAVVRDVSLLQETGEGIGMKVGAEGFSDRLLVGFGAAPRTIALRSPEGEAFRFSGYGYVRVAGQSVVARGNFD